MVKIEKKITDILFERGYVLSYKEVEPSSPEDMYEITFYLENNGIKQSYKTMFIRNTKYPRRKAFSILLDEIINGYYDSINIGKKEDVVLSD